MKKNLLILGKILKKLRPFQTSWIRNFQDCLEDEFKKNNNSIILESKENTKQYNNILRNKVIINQLIKSRIQRSQFISEWKKKTLEIDQIANELAEEKRKNNEELVSTKNIIDILSK